MYTYVLNTRVVAGDVESCDSNQSSLISHQLVHICYDELMPAELESKLVADADGLSSVSLSIRYIL